MTPNAAGWRSSAAYEHIAEMSPSDLTQARIVFRLKETSRPPGPPPPRRH